VDQPRVYRDGRHREVRVIPRIALAEEAGEPGRRGPARCPALWRRPARPRSGARRPPVGMICLAIATTHPSPHRPATGTGGPAS